MAEKRELKAYRLGMKYGYELCLLELQEIIGFCDDGLITQKDMLKRIRALAKQRYTVVD